MPQIANTHTLPEWENGYLLAGNLKTLNGIATLNISGDWNSTRYPNGLTAITNTAETGYYAIPFIGSYSSSTRTTLVQIKIYDTTTGLIATTSNVKIHYIIWLNDSNSKFVLPTETETIKLL